MVKCQQVFEEAYIARKRCNEAKWHAQESIKKIMTADWNLIPRCHESKSDTKNNMNTSSR